MGTWTEISGATDPATYEIVCRHGTIIDAYLTIQISGDGTGSTTPASVGDQVVVDMVAALTASGHFTEISGVRRYGQSGANYSA